MIGLDKDSIRNALRHTDDELSTSLCGPGLTIDLRTLGEVLGQSFATGMSDALLDPDLREDAMQDFALGVIGGLFSGMVREQLYRADLALTPDDLDYLESVSGGLLRAAPNSA